MRETVSRNLNIRNRSGTNYLKASHRHGYPIAVVHVDSVAGAVLKLTEIGTEKKLMGVLETPETFLRLGRQ